MGTEDILSEKGKSVIGILHSLANALRLYDVNNAAVSRQVDALFDELAPLAQNNLFLRLTLRDDEFFINDALLKADLRLYVRAKELAEILESFEYNDLRILGTTTKQDMENFVLELSKSIKIQDHTLKGQSFGGISGQKAKGSSAAAFRFEPDKLSIWLYSGLLDVVEALYSSHEEGDAPSLLALRRSLQMIIDNIREFNGIYQMLSAFRSPKEARSKANMRVAMAVDIIGFGIFLGRGNMELLEFALATILSGLEESDDPIDTIQPLFRYSGLGQTALGLIVSLYESRMGRMGKSISLSGQILLVVEEYHRKLHQSPETPLPKLIYELLQITDLKSPLFQLFARYKGPFPIGSFITVDDELMLVIGQSRSAIGKQRPIVMRIVQGRLVQSIDLSREEDRRISQISSLGEQDFVLEDLVM